MCRGGKEDVKGVCLLVVGKVAMKAKVTRITLNCTVHKTSYQPLPRIRTDGERLVHHTNNRIIRVQTINFL